MNPKRLQFSRDKFVCYRYHAAVNSWHFCTIRPGYKLQKKNYNPRTELLIFSEKGRAFNQLSNGLGMNGVDTEEYFVCIATWVPQSFWLVQIQMTQPWAQLLQFTPSAYYYYLFTRVANSEEGNKFPLTFLRDSSISSDFE